MTGRRVGRAPAAALVALALLLSGCAGVPDSSDPQVVSRLTGGVKSPNPVITPATDAKPRDIVLGFLENNAANDTHHAAARAFLTPDMASRWVDDPVTVFKDAKQVKDFDPRTDTVTVTGVPAGSIDENGIYTPAVSAASGAPITIQYRLARQAGQWRIASLPNGVVIEASDFIGYSTRPIYFYDNATQQDLVEDPRHTNLSDPGQLAAWAMQKLVAGPRPDLSDAVSSPVSPQIDPRRVSVTLGKTLDVNLPGVGSLAPGNLQLLAAEVAKTLDSIDGSVPIRLVDGRPVTIPDLGRATFTVADFYPPSTRSVPPAQLYYLADGSLDTSSGTPVPGPLGDGTYYLNSVGVSQGRGPTDPEIAGTVTDKATQRLWIGTQSRGLRATRLVGTALTRPSWSPVHDLVWVGSGSRMWQVSLTGAVQSVTLVTDAGGPLDGTIRAVRFSPDGVRVALVVAQPGGGPSQVWTGAVVQNGSLVSVHGLVPITSDDIRMTDVAWNGPRTLFAIGRVGTGDEGNLYEYDVDGVPQSVDAIIGLPQAPDSLTVSSNQPAWVSAGDSVWQQQQNSRWITPPRTSGDAATKPVYVEP